MADGLVKIGGTKGKFICKDRGGGGKRLYLYIVKIGNSPRNFDVVPYGLWVFIGHDSFIINQGFNGDLYHPRSFHKFPLRESPEQKKN